MGRRLHVIPEDADAGVYHEAKEDGALLVNGQEMPELTPDQLKAGIPSAKDLKVNPDLI